MFCNEFLDLRLRKLEEVRRFSYFITFLIDTVYQILLDNKIGEDEMGGMCSTNRRDEKFLQDMILKKMCFTVWIQLAQGRIH